MDLPYQIGDLVHIPQAVTLVDSEALRVPGDQLNIPTRVVETTTPLLGVITHVLGSGYVEVYCDGDSWSVKDESVYRL